MPKFLTDLVVSPTRRKGMWVLKEELVYRTGLNLISKEASRVWSGQSTTWEVRVPIGFKTDLASIPFGLRNLFNINGRHRNAAVVHDYLCKKKDFSRKKADQVFYEAMRVCEVKRWRAITMYAAVRTYGVVSAQLKTLKAKAKGEFKKW